MDSLFQVLFHYTSVLLTSTFPLGTIRYRLLFSLSYGTLEPWRTSQRPRSRFIYPDEPRRQRRWLVTLGHLRPFGGFDLSSRGLSSKGRCYATSFLRCFYLFALHYSERHIIYVCVSSYLDISVH